jgi:hypothetical protein
MLNSLMYKLSYYRFDEVVTGHGRKTGWDTVRQVEIGVTLSRLEILIVVVVGVIFKQTIPFESMTMRQAFFGF